MSNDIFIYPESKESEQRAFWVQAVLTNWDMLPVVGILKRLRDSVGAVIHK